MKNVTVSMKEEVARWARIEAARQGRSMSRLIGELVEAHMSESEAYETHMREYLARDAAPIGDGAPYPKREELYDRGRRTWARDR